MKKNLIIAPHYDDEILGVGGTISKLNKKEEFYVCIITNGSLSATKNVIRKNFLKKQNIIKNIVKLTNISKYYSLNLPATKLDQIALSNISDSLIKVIKKVKPYKVYIPSNKDMHIDHRITFEASLVALRPIYNQKIEMVLSYEVLSETDWGSELGKKFNPNYYQKISKEDLEFKIKLFKFYESEVKKYPHPRSEKGIKNLASIRGQYINCNYAEAFEIVKYINY